MIKLWEFHIKSLNPIRQDCALDTIVYAHVRGPLASPILTNSSQCVPRDTVFFSDGSAYYLNSTALGYYWDFGDSEALNQDYVPYNPYQFNQFSTMKDTKHFYQKIGCYGGTFTVVDSITGCSNNTSFLISTSNVGKFNLSVADKQSVYCETDTIHFIANLIGNNYQEIDQNHIQNPLCPGFSILSKETYYGDYGRERKTGLPVYRFKTDSYCEPQDVSIVSNDSTRKYYFANGSNTPTYVSDSVCYIENNFNDLITVDNNPEAFLSLVKATPLGCEKLEIDVKILTHDSVQAIKLKWTDGDSLFYQFDTLTMWDTTLSITVDTGIYKMYHTFYSKCSCETLDSISFGGGLSMKPIIRAICGGSHFDIDYEAQYLGDGYSFTGDSLKESYNWQFDTLGWTRNMDTMIPYDTFGGYNLRLAYSDSSGNCIDTITTLVPVKKVFADFSSSNDEIYCKKLIDFYDESIVKDSGSITQWSWNLTDGNSSSEKNPFKLFKLKGTYDIELIATSLEGCKDTVKKEIILDGPNPVFALKSDTIGCKPLEVKLADRSTNNKLQIWEWNDRSGSLTDSKLGDDSINVFTYTEPGIYCPILRVYDTVYTRDNYHVCTEFFPDPDYNHPKICVEVVDSVNLNFEIDNVACTGQSIDLINNNQNINLDYYYHNGDTNLVRSWNQYPYYNVEEKGGYINFVFYAESRPGSDYPNCSDTFRKSIEVQDPDIDMDFCLNSKDLTWKTINVNTNSEYITKYLWESDHGTIKDRRKSTATISYESNVIKKTICLTGWTSKGCENSICKDVYLPNIELFNVFTPNSDNQNNSYDIVTKELTSYHIEIYNRYGELVFKSSIDGNGDSPHNWNGKNMNTGIPVPEGTYFYILKYKVNECKNETHTIEGTVDLIR